MITEQLISPGSIVVVGGSDDVSKPGGSALKNLINLNYKGRIYVVNPKGKNIQGKETFPSLEELPPVDCAILAIPAKMCVEAVRTLCEKKGCKALIIYSAGFQENSAEGARYEREIVECADRCGASVIGPNCIGVATPHYAGIFTQPVSNLSPNGIDIISGSGATVVFIMEAARQHGIRFANVFSVGNSAQTGVEDVLKYMDEHYIPGKSSPVKLLYIESIADPDLLLKHARSLVLKGARIAAIKAGYSETGSRAASSHTGALATPDAAVNALFRKAGIVRAYSREELVNIASVMMCPRPVGNRMAIVTHAGGPAVMLTDILSTSGVEIPKLSGEKADELLSELYLGSSVGNPIDFLATGTGAQLSRILEACERDFDVDSIAVIFGCPGLSDVTDVYKGLLKKIKECRKPVYSILPSIINAKDAIETFQKMGGISFNDEVAFGEAFVKVMNTPAPEEEIIAPAVDKQMIRSVIEECQDGFLPPRQVQLLLDAAGIGRVKEMVAGNVEEALEAVREIGYPVAMKVIGPIHKTDVGGVSLNVNDDNTLSTEFTRMMSIEGTSGILLQPMLYGTELFIGAKREEKFGTVVMCGLGGIFIETLKDTGTALAPVSRREAEKMITGLKGYGILAGTRGKEGVNTVLFNEAIRRVSALCTAAPEISEMDLNPLLGNARTVTVVDARIKIKK